MSDLIQKEKELLKINSDLDKKTKNILNPVKLVVSEGFLGKSSHSTFRNRQMNSDVTKGNENDGNLIKNKSNGINTATYTKVKGVGKKTNKLLGNKRENVPIVLEDCEEEQVSSPPAEEENYPNTQESQDSSEKLNTNPVKKAAVSKQPGSYRTYTKKPSPALSSGGLISLLRSKIGILEGELEITNEELTKRIKQIEILTDNLKKLETQRDQGLLKNNALIGDLKRLQDKLYMMEVKQKDMEGDQMEKLHELEETKRQIKRLTQTNRNLEKRLGVAIENVTRMEERVKEMENAERESKDWFRKDKETLERQLNQAKRQKGELLIAYKKQLFVIDNLRRQNACQEQARMINFGEKEFSKVLDWNNAH